MAENSNSNLNSTDKPKVLFFSVTIYSAASDLIGMTTGPGYGPLSLKGGGYKYYDIKKGLPSTARTNIGLTMAIYILVIWTRPEEQHLKFIAGIGQL